MASLYKVGNKYKIGFTDEAGRHRVIVAGENHRVAKEIKADLEAKLERRKRGIGSAAEDRYADQGRVLLVVKDANGKVVGGHLADWHADVLPRATGECTP